MYLTRMKLDTSRSSTMIALACPNKLHGAIEASFPGERKRRLWRVDSLRGISYLMLLSDTEPDLSNVFRQFGPVNEDPFWETKDYSPLLDRIEDGSMWRFRLVACPCKCVSSENTDDARRGKIVAHTTVAQQKEWLLSRAAANGFSLLDHDFDVVFRDIKEFTKGCDSANKVTLSFVMFEGVLTVTDKEKFCHLLTHGLGRGKAYGLGMMTVVRFM